jgi:hypothetical protein
MMVAAKGTGVVCPLSTALAAVGCPGLLEAMSRIEADAYQLLTKLGATPVKRVLTAGGGAVNTKWTAMRAAALGVPVAAAAQGMNLSEQERWGGWDRTGGGLTAKGREEVDGVGVVGGAALSPLCPAVGDFNHSLWAVPDNFNCHRQQGPSHL